MKHYRHLLLLLALLLGHAAWAQYDPQNPDEPGTRPWRLTLLATPNDAGYFNLSAQSQHAAGEEMQLRAYSNNNYKFVRWEDAQGNILATESSFSYAMPARDVTLTARYEYTPNNPDEPQQTSIKRHLFLRTNPEGAGWFNLSSDNNIATGQQVNIHAYAHEHYIFRNWTFNGNVVSSAAYFSYTMPDHNVTLVANYDYNYQPDSPSEPGQQLGSHYNIYGMRESVMAGQTVNYPLYLQNVGSAAVTGFQIDVTLPQGFVADAQAAALTDRAADHSLQAETTDDGGWRFTVSGATAIDGVEGKVLLLPISVPDTATTGLTFPVKLSGGLVFLNDGQQDSIAVRSGSLKIQRSADDVPDSPDYIVTNVQTTTTDVMPGGTVSIEWQVQNQGNMTGIGGWTERIYLVTPQGRKVNIGSTSYDTTELKPGSTVSRNATVSLAQLPGIDGPADVAVTIVPAVGAGELVDFIGNNTGLTTGQPITVGKRLVLTVPQTPQQEGDVSTIRCQLARSGNWTQDESFQLTKLAGDDRISMPETVVIPREQAAVNFYLPLTNDGECNADSIFAFSIQGNGYEAVDARLVVNDDEMPSLRLTTSTTEVTEGDTFQLTVTLDKPAQKDIPINISAELPQRFSLHNSIIIPAGYSSLNIDITAIDNDEIDTQQTVAFRVNSDEYMEAECLIQLNDNDMPTLSFSLSPQAVSEADGHTALLGVISRSDHLNSRLTLLLTDDSNGLITYPTQTIVLERGKQNVQFNLGVTDNKLVDGDHEVMLTASIYSASCDCQMTGDGQGQLQAKVTIIDDDGPALSIKPAATAMLEGSQGNVFVISHNTASTNDVHVTISSDEEEKLVYDHELTIPAGSTSANLLVTVKHNDTSDDSNIVTFKVEADGYAMGTCWLLITDQTLPDATITLHADRTEAEAEETVGLTLVVKNAGKTPLNSRTPIALTFSAQKSPIELIVGKQLQPGDSAVIDYNFLLPAIIGHHYFEAQVNQPVRVEELLYLNNSSGSLPFNILPSFTATIKADKDSYRQGDSISISGTATGSKAANAEVEIYLVNGGYRQAISTTADDQGRFAAVFKPLASQVGHFAMGACYPGEGLTTEMDAFDVIGLTSTQRYTTCELSQTDTYTGKIVFENPTSIKQSGFKAVLKGDSENCEFRLDAPNAIEAGKKAEVTFTIVGNELSTGREWQRMPIEVTTIEGAVVSHIIYYYVHPLHAQLQTSTTSIVTTMTLGTPREYPLTIRNIGRAETGKITLSLPSWMETVTPREMPSMQHGDSTTIMLRFMPFEEMKLNIPVSGHFGINCENGDGVKVNFSITPVSETKGKLTVDVIDEYTYFTEEAPHVSDARVRLMHPATREVVTEGYTDIDGTFIVKLPEGNYIVSVEADQHKGYEGQMLISPGEESSQEVFISYQAITYDWGVVETEVDDEYEIETIVNYETRVPKPVVTISLPRKRPEPYSILPITLTNHGLVHALDVSAWFTTSAGYRLEPLNDTWLDTLQAQQSYVIYARLIPEQQEAETRAKHQAPSSNDCFGYRADERHKEPCDKYPDYEYSHDKVNFGNCYSGGGGSGGGGYRKGYGGPGSPNIWENYTTDNNYSTGYDNNGDPARFCDNGPHNVDDYGPINRPIVPDKAIPEIECGGEEPLVLEYKLVPVTGTRYEMLGVVADGLSQVKLVLDPEQSKIPNADCKECAPHSWTLTSLNGEMEDLGSIEPLDGWEAIYTAPANFPFENGSKVRIKASIHYICNQFPGSEDVIIEITRPPVVFIHGLGSNMDCWKEAANDLTNHSLYPEGFIHRVDYRNTNTSTFMSNVGVVSDGIFMAQKKAIKRGFMATKCDLVGHSMGGILARLFVERGGRKEDVYRIITVNTPHSGSELGDIVRVHNLVLRKAAQWFYHKDDIDAVRDLGVESDEMALLVNVPGKFDIPVYALGTQSDLRDVIMLGGNIALTEMCKAAFVASVAGAAFDPDPLTKTMLTVVSLAVGFAASEGSHLLNNDYAQVGIGDLVVSSDSQRGGCDASEIIEHGPWHCNSTNDPKVIQRIKELLVTPDIYSTFSTNWFKPAKRPFEHSGWKLWGGRILNALGTIKPIAGVATSGISLFQSYSFLIKAATSSLQQSRNRTSSQDAQSRTLSMELNISDELSLVSACVYLNGELAYFMTKDDCEYTIPSTFSGEVSVRILVKDSDDNLYSDERTLTIDEPLVTPVSIDAENMSVIAGKDYPMNVVCTWSNEAKTVVMPDCVEFDKEGIASYANGYIKGLNAGSIQATITYAGMTCNTTIDVFASNVTTDDKDDSDAVCTTVKLSFKQKSVMTRQAFRGTLTVNNGNPSEAMRDVKLHLEVRDPQGLIATKREFQIDAEKLEGFDGELALDAGWTLAAGSTGTTTILFIPTKYAAPTEPIDYSFGGTFSYIIASTGQTVTLPLSPVTLTVNPAPNLEMTYFMQRDVYSDDPLTEAIEPTIPSEFAILINNKGYGDATNVRMVTQQPKIVENEKGLLIDFKLVSSQVNGEPAVLNFSDVITNDFGTIPAKSQSYAQWWLTSTLMGHFIDYDVKATHVTSYGNEDLSLLDEVSIHELIHGFTPPIGTGRGFLVNDVVDADDMPDEVYLTDGTQQSVTRATGATISMLANNQYQLTITPATMGWVYGSLPDPTDGRLQIASIIRQRDGATLPIDNAWQTPVTMRNGKDPVHERRLHFVCNTQGGSETWLVSFEERPQEQVGIEEVRGVAERGRISIGPLPLATYMYVKGDFSEVRNIEMFDLRGIRLLNTRGMPARQGIYVGQLPAGVYQVRVSTDAGTYHAKVLKR